MKKKFVFTVFCFVGMCIVFSQEDLPITMQNLEGIWLYIDTPEDPNTNNMRSITINKSGKSLGFSYELNGKWEQIGESYYGFQNYNQYETKAINKKDLKITGKYYTTIDIKWMDKDGYVKVPAFRTPQIIELTENSLWINYGKVSVYEKNDKLSAIDLKLLYLRGKKDNRDYIKEYLNLDVKEIIVPKSIIYSEPDKPTKMYLIKNDIVTIVEERDNWIKIEYSGEKLVTGWIKKGDVSKD